MNPTKEQAKQRKLEKRLRRTKQQNSIEAVFDTSERMRPYLSPASQKKLDSVVQAINIYLQKNRYQEAEKLFYDKMPAFAREMLANQKPKT